ncbi:MAG: hypothetical protein ABGY96_11135 [bacterium]|nr:hypothetical protein [Gammaproteobacteria bacterium]HIL99279.1 hypothetical protein [Pseudomonadales bacterium]
MKGKDTEPNAGRPAQIPLLEDVVFHTSLPIPDPPRRRRANDHERQIVAPQMPDLFSGSPETAGMKPPASTDPAHLNRNESDEEITEGIKGELRQKTSTIIDSLVDEYSTEIVRRLRDELTSLLADMENKKP